MSVEALAWVLLAITLAYAVFGLTGFGGALVAVPMLVQVMPLQDAVPFVLLLDLVCTPIVGFGNHRRVAWPELRRLVPFMLVGVGLGATLLASHRSGWLMVALGVFVLVLALRGLLQASKPESTVATGWAAPAGLVGGVSGALFGIGGPIYTTYLVRRLPDTEVFRATISMVILVSGVVRLAAFVVTGLMGSAGLWKTAATALPFCLAGLWAGTQLRKRVPGAGLRKLIYVLLAASGASVLYRATLA